MNNSIGVGVLSGRIVTSAERRGTFIDLVLLASIWMLAAILVDPRGDFPINDDFFYWIDVQRLLDEGRYRPTGFESATLITHIGWGAFFGKIFGPSYEVLRFSVLFLSLFGVLCLYSVAKKMNCSRRVSLYAALVFAFNPIYFSLSFSYMSDVTFTAFMLVGLLFLVRYLDGAGYRDLLLGTFASTVAILCRQTGLAVPAAFCITVLITRGRRDLSVALFPLMTGGLAYCAFSFWLLARIDNREFYGHMEQNFLASVATSPQALLFKLLNNTYIAMMYLGLFLLPLMVYLARFRYARSASFWLRIVVPSLILFIAITSFKGGWMPLVGNYMGRGSLGPLFFPALVDFGGPPDYPQGFWALVTVLSVLGAAFLLATLIAESFGIFSEVSGKGNRKKDSARILLLLSAAVYLLPVMSTWFFDRYLAPPVALFLLFFAARSYENKISLWGELSVVSVLLLYMLFSVVATHDYMALSRAKWMALEDLVSEGVPPEMIDGGYEFNGVHLFKSYAEHKEKIWGTRIDSRDPYIIAFDMVPGYEVKSRLTSNGWGPGQHNLFILKRY